MSQHDLNIANALSATARSDMNSALVALGTNSSGSTAPSTTHANMTWYDTSSNLLKQRSEADDAWISIGYLNQSTDKFELIDDTLVVDASGTQTGLLGDQATSAWQSGLSTTQSLVSPANVKSAVDSFATSPIKAWVNFNGTNASIRASSGISTIVRNSEGIYTITFTTSLMPDANYCLTGAAGSTVGDNRFVVQIYQLNQGSCVINVMNHGNAFKVDATWVCVEFVR